MMKQYPTRSWSLRLFCLPLMAVIGGSTACGDDGLGETGDDGLEQSSSQDGSGSADDDDTPGSGSGDEQSSEDGGSQDDDGDSSGGDGGFDPCSDDDADAPGPRMLRRLTAAEFEATIRDVFELDPGDWAGPTMPPDPAAANGFTNNAEQLKATESYVERLNATAATIAEQVVQPERLSELLPCSASGGDESCGEAYLDTVGRRLFRRPLSSAEKTRYLDLWDLATAGDKGLAGWVRHATIALIQSPHTINRSELGEGSGDSFELTGYEIATALAYGYSGRPPSEALLDRAASGELADADVRREVARDLVFGGRSKPGTEYRDVFMAFARQYLGIPRVGNLIKGDPEFDEAVRASMIREAELVVADVVFEGGGGAHELLAGRETFVDGVLSDYYGFGDVSGGDFERVERPAELGSGLMALGGLMASTATTDSTSPTQRGAFVRLKLLCSELERPAEVPELPDPKEFDTTRERYEYHVSEPECAACHKMLDPIGFSFEHIDAAGRFRMLENGHEIDASATILATSRGDVDVDGAAEMSDLLAELPETSYCLAAYLASYSFGLDHKAARCLVDGAASGFAEDGQSMIDYHLALTAAPHFVRRSR